MEIIGKIKKIDETKTYGNNGFRKREFVVTTEEQYPQHILMEVTQDKCDILNDFEVGQSIKVSINLRGREWVNPQGEAVYFNSIQAWRIEKMLAAPNVVPSGQDEGFPPFDGGEIDKEEEDDDLPF